MRPYDSITGIVTYSFEEFKINPRSQEDIVGGEEGSVLVHLQLLQKYNLVTLKTVLSPLKMLWSQRQSLILMAIPYFGCKTKVLESGLVSMSSFAKILLPPFP